jgi:spore maturation protein CgeB
VRCVMVGSFACGTTEAGLAHGLRRCGWLIDEVELLRHLRHGHDKIMKIAERLLRRRNQASYNQAILNSVADCAPQIFLTVKGSFVTAETLEELGRRDIFRVLFYPDVEFDHVGMDGAIHLYDLVITTKSFHSSYLDRVVGPERWAYVDHGYVAEHHRAVSVPDREEDYRYDILFIGTYSSYKAQWLEQVVRVNKDRSILIVGNQWQEKCRGTLLESFTLGRSVSGDFYADLIGASRINVALHTGPVRTPGWEDRISTRTFEIPACGGFMLHIDNDEVRRLYDVPSEIDTFASPEELVAKTEHYLKRPDERRRIAAAGHRRAVPSYSLDSRAVQVDQLVRARLHGE